MKKLKLIIPISKAYKWESRCKLNFSGLSSFPFLNSNKLGTQVLQEVNCFCYISLLRQSIAKGPNAIPGDLERDLCRLSRDLLRCRLGLLLRCLSRRGEGLWKWLVRLISLRQRSHNSIPLPKSLSLLQITEDLPPPFWRPTPPIWKEERE